MEVRKTRLAATGTGTKFFVSVIDDDGNLRHDAIKLEHEVDAYVSQMKKKYITNPPAGAQSHGQETRTKACHET